MTQKIFDVENEKDMADLWDILPDDIIKVKQRFADGSGTVYVTKTGSCVFDEMKIIKINWHDKTEITRPIQEADKADIGKLCYFWNDDDPPEYGQLLYVYSSPEDREGKYQQGHNDGSWPHCRRLTKQEIEELC